MQKKTSMYRSKNQQFNIAEEEDQGIHFATHLFSSKFIKELNFQQNYNKCRQRRIKKMNQLFYLKGTILDTIVNENEKQKSAKQLKGTTSQNVKEIYYKGSIIKGRLKKKMLHGDTEIIYENDVQFKGVFKNGKMRTGKFDFKNGYEYWGELEGKTFLGKGTLKCPNGTRITGVWNGDQIVGRAQIQYSTGDVYYGEIKNFQKHGEGYLFFKTGNKYIGHFQYGQMTGFGTYFKTDGTSQNGSWKNGQLIQRKEDSKNNIKSSQNSDVGLLIHQKAQYSNIPIEVPSFQEEISQHSSKTSDQEQYSN